MYFYQISSGENVLEEEFLVIGHHKSFTKVTFDNMCDDILRSNIITDVYQMVNILCHERGFKKIKTSKSHKFSISGVTAVSDIPVRSEDDNNDTRQYRFIYKSDDGDIELRILIGSPIGLYKEMSYESKLGEVEARNILTQLIEKYSKVVPSGTGICPVFSSDQNPYRLDADVYENRITIEYFIFGATGDDLDRSHEFLSEYVREKLELLMVIDDGKR